MVKACRLYLMSGLIIQIRPLALSNMILIMISFCVCVWENESTKWKTMQLEMYLKPSSRLRKLFKAFQMFWDDSGRRTTKLTRFYSKNLPKIFRKFRKTFCVNIHSFKGTLTCLSGHTSFHFVESVSPHKHGPKS